MQTMEMNKGKAMKRRMPINSASGYGKVSEDILKAVRKIAGRSMIGKDLTRCISDVLEDYPSELSNYSSLFYLD